MVESPPMRGRGLKLAELLWGRGIWSVAPHAGAWIETRSEAVNVEYAWSPPMRGRGLKPRIIRLLSAGC